MVRRKHPKPLEAEVPKLSSEDTESLVEAPTAAPPPHHHHHTSPLKIPSKFSYLVDICELQLIIIPSKSSLVSA